MSYMVVWCPIRLCGVIYGCVYSCVVSYMVVWRLCGVPIRLCGAL